MGNGVEGNLLYLTTRKRCTVFLENTIDTIELRKDTLKNLTEKLLYFQNSKQFSSGSFYRKLGKEKLGFT